MAVSKLHCTALCISLVVALSSHAPPQCVHSSFTRSSLRPLPGDGYDECALHLCSGCTGACSSHSTLPPSSRSYPSAVACVCVCVSIWMRRAMRMDWSKAGAAGRPQPNRPSAAPITHPPPMHGGWRVDGQRERGEESTYGLQWAPTNSTSQLHPAIIQPPALHLHCTALVSSVVSLPAVGLRPRRIHSRRPSTRGTKPHARISAASAPALALNGMEWSKGRTWRLADDWMTGRICRRSPPTGRLSTMHESDTHIVWQP